MKKSIVTGALEVWKLEFVARRSLSKQTEVKFLSKDLGIWGVGPKTAQNSPNLNDPLRSAT